MENKTETQLRFDDPRLWMSIPGRMFVRLAGYVSYIVLLAAMFTFLGSDTPWLVWTGIFLVFFFLDRAVHRNKADRMFYDMPSGGNINLAHYLSPRAFSRVEKAFDKHVVAGGSFPLELLRELLILEDVRKILNRLDVPLDELRQRMEDLIKDSFSVKSNPPLAREQCSEIIIGAFRASRATHNLYIELPDLLPGLAGLGDPLVDRLLEMFSVSADDASKALFFGKSMSKSKFGRRRANRLGGIIGRLKGPRHRIMNRAWTSRPTPTLDKYGVDYTDRARAGFIGFMIGHEKEYEHLVQILARDYKPNALLVGDPTTGKDTIAAHLALAMSHDSVPPALFDKRLVRLDVIELAAGGKNNIEKEIGAIINEIIIAGNIILYIPEFHELVEGMSDIHLAMANAFLPAMKEGLFPVLATSFPAEYKRHLEPRSDITNIFEIVRINEISESETERILVREAMILESEGKTMIGFKAIKKAAQIAKKYLRDSYLPGSALNILREAYSRAEKAGDEVLEEDRIIEVAEMKTNIPIHAVAEEESSSLLNLEEIIHKNYVDQEEGVRAVADALREYRSGLTRKGGPIASFLFAGPTGVGKTELAKAIARVEFGTEESLIRFDMTEYQDALSIHRFIGDPDGQSRGALTEAVLDRPYAVILLDEFEKANPDILNIFLQVFDDGRLTDNLGRVISFENTVIIATSNAHSQFILDSIRAGDALAIIEERLKKRMAEIFRPELINRFSKIIMFKSLGRADVRKIAELQLGQLGKQLSLQGISLTITPQAADYISELGYSPEFGARPLRLIIEEKLRAPLARMILDKRIRNGSSVRMEKQGSDIVFL